MEAFLGTWKVQLEKTSGVEELGKLFGWDDAKRKMYATLSYTLLLESKGDGYRAFLDYTQFNITIEPFKLGEEVEYTSPDGTKALLTVKIEGGAMLESYRTKEGVTWKTVRTVEGNNMTAVTTSVMDPSISCKQSMERV